MIKRKKKIYKKKSTTPKRLGKQLKGELRSKVKSKTPWRKVYAK